MTPALRRPRADHGAVAVEFALVLPVLVVLIFGVIQFGIIFSQSSALANAARSGARLGSVNLYASAASNPHTCQDVLQATRDQALGLGMPAQNVKVTVKVGMSEATATQKCSVNAGSSLPTTDVTTAPCIGGSVDRTLYVQAEFGASLSIPPILNTSFPLKATGAYRCEYSS